LAERAGGGGNTGVMQADATGRRVLGQPGSETTVFVRATGVGTIVPGDSISDPSSLRQFLRVSDFHQFDWAGRSLRENQQKHGKPPYYRLGFK
jgi:hypothetical protein